jgi:hypothetical protein
MPTTFNPPPIPQLHQSISWAPTRTLPKGIAVVFAFLLAAVVGCGSTQDTNTLTTSPSKPDLPDLSDRMVIAESQFPPVPDGTFRSYPVETLPSHDRYEDPCDPRSWTTDGDQEVTARVRSNSTDATYRMNISDTRKRVDLDAWANDCLPYTMDGDSLLSRIDLPGLPPGTVTFEISGERAPYLYSALGYIRGILVSASVSNGNNRMPAGAKSDLVKLFTAQAERLQSY